MADGAETEKERERELYLIVCSFDNHLFCGVKNRLRTHANRVFFLLLFSFLKTFCCPFDKNCPSVGDTFFF